MVLNKIESDGLPSLVTKMEKRAATRLVKLQKDAAKASKLLTKLPPEVRDDVKRIWSWTSKQQRDLADHMTSFLTKPRPPPRRRDRIFTN